VLGSGPYSGAAAADVGLDEAEWTRSSIAIRLEHECTHHFTRRVLGSMRNRLADELIADYMGIVAATGRFRADWLVRFLGLERYPIYRPVGVSRSTAGTSRWAAGASGSSVPRPGAVHTTSRRSIGCGRPVPSPVGACPRPAAPPKGGAG
jgi:uncharacterized protein DUF7005